jgi:hypothetical protein
VSVESGRDNQTRKSKTVADLLDGLTSGTQSRGSDISTAVVVDNNADNDVDNGDNGLAKDKSLLVVLGLTHLGSDGEEDGGTAVGKDEGGDSRHGVGEARAVEQLVVGLPDTILGGEVGAVLDTNSDGNDEDWMLLDMSGCVL